MQNFVTNRTKISFENNNQPLMNEMLVGDIVDVVGGSYKGDYGYIVKILDVRVKVRLVGACKVSNLNRSSLTRRQGESTPDMEIAEERRQSTDGVHEEERENESVDYLIKKIKRLRLTNMEKLKLVDILKDEIRTSLGGNG
jgi:ribosomal protein L14E/L6E/L27E